MNRRMFHRLGLGLVAASTVEVAQAAETQMAPATKNKLALQVSSDDHKTQELALGNAHHYATYYEAKKEAFAIEIVAFGPGYGMLRDDTSKVKEPIEKLMAALGGSITFAACQNTRKAIAKSAGKEPEAIPQIKGVVDAPSGVVRLAELQQQGWSYVKP